MDKQDTSLLESGQRVGLAMASFAKELADFQPLQTAETDRGELVTAIEARQAAQDATTMPTTLAKDSARELMAITTATLSARAVGYALSIGNMALKQTFTLSYSDVRYGEATEGVNHVRALVAAVQGLPDKDRTAFRLTKEVLQAPIEAADAFGVAADLQTNAKAVPRLATLALPELLRRLGAALQVMKALIEGQRTDTDPNFQWPALDAAFAEANKRRAVPSKFRQTVGGRPRIIRTLPVSMPDGRAARLANTNYGSAYTLTVENNAATSLLLWMGQKDGAKTTPFSCPAGAVTVLTRADIGPDTARYLMGAFDGAAGGQATVVVRRVVA